MARHEKTKSRVYLLDDTRLRLMNLSLKQKELFREGLQCIEHELYRASYVMSWAAFVDYYEDKLFLIGLEELKKIWASLAQYKNIEEIRENVNENQLIQLGRQAKLLSKPQFRELDGYLSTRNQCAHPTEFRAGMNESLGYLASLLGFIERLEKKKWPS